MMAYPILVGIAELYGQGRLEPRVNEVLNFLLHPAVLVFVGSAWAGILSLIIAFLYKLPRNPPE